MIDNIIGPFQDEYRFLSNFWVDNRGFCVEIPYQAAKTNDMDEKRRLLASSGPGEAKRLGRSVSLREDWDEVKDDIMLALLRLKFSNPEMAKLLAGTEGFTLVEYNSWGDTYWGMTNEGKGKNRLGELLMQVREELLLGYLDSSDATIEGWPPSSQ